MTPQTIESWQPGMQAFYVPREAGGFTMKHFAYNEQGCEYPVQISAAEILRDYYPGWADKMQAVGKAHLMTPEACLEDWQIVHWAWELEGEPR